MSSIKEEYIKHKYIKGDEFVTDGVTIMGCREERSRDIIDNGRLGTYDNYGNYIILDSIKEELIRLPKVVTLTSASASFSGGSDEYEAKANIPIFGDIKFKLVVNNSMATFFLIEKVNREAGGYLEIYEEKLESIDLKKEALDLPFIFSYFNISNGDIDLGQKWKEINIPNILTRKVYMAALSKKIKENSDQVTEEQAFNRMVDMLRSEGGEYGQNILDKLDERMKEKGEFSAFKGTNAYGKALNDILLGTIHLVNSEEPELSFENKELYYELLEIRNNTTRDILVEARNELSNADVELAVEKINQLMKSGDLDEDLIFDYPDEEGTRDLRKAILKKKAEKEEEEVSDLNEDGTPKTKEQKIKEILEGKKKKAQKKVVPAKKPPAKQKMKAKGKSKKKAAGKKKAKGKKKVKKPVVKKAAKGLKPGKAKKGAVVAKKKKKKNKNELDLYRRDAEFLRNLFVTPAIYNLRGLSNDKPIEIKHFKPQSENREANIEKENNIFGRATRTQGQRAANQEEGRNLFRPQVSPNVKYERNLAKINNLENSASQNITPVLPGNEADIMADTSNQEDDFGRTSADRSDGRNLDDNLRAEANPFAAGMTPGRAEDNDQLIPGVGGSFTEGNPFENRDLGEQNPFDQNFGGGMDFSNFDPFKN